MDSKALRELSSAELEFPFAPEQQFNIT